MAAQTATYNASRRISPESFERTETPAIQSDASDTADDEKKSYGGSDAAGRQSNVTRDIEKQQHGPPGGPPGGPPAGPRDPNVVEWDGPNDPGNPMNWSLRKKWINTLVLGMMTFCVTFSSSIFSVAIPVTSRKFGVSREVMTLSTSIFIFGFSVGPIVFGPLSELFGRRIPLFIGFFGFCVFHIPVAVAQNVETIMLCRFFQGVFGVSPLAIIGGAIADFWDPVMRGVAVCVFTGATFVGPLLGPIIGGFITQSYLGWRWTMWITLIMSVFFGVIAWFVYPETYHPVLLQQRAKKLRYETKNWAIRSRHDENQITMHTIVYVYLFKPFIMLAQEPILMLITLYMSFVYALLYVFFSAYPVSFQEERGWNLGVGSLPLLALAIGVVIGGSITCYIILTRFARIFRETGQVVPEERLIPMIIGGATLPAGMFWFAWTSSPNISWVPQVLAGIPIGAGVLMIFMQGFNYLIDVYKMHANSALAANTMIRSFVGGGFPMFAAIMYHNLGVPWASSTLGFLCIALFPVSIVFYVYGKKIREWSKFSPT